MAINEQITARIQVFTAELESLVRAAALDAVRQALGGGAAPVKAAVARAAAPKAAVVSAPAPSRSRSRKSAGGKRPPGQLAALVTRAGDWIKANPGHGVEHMAKALHVRTKEFALPIQKLCRCQDDQEARPEARDEVLRGLKGRPRARRAW